MKRMRHTALLCATVGSILATGCVESTSDLDDDLLVALAEQAAGDADDDVQAMRAPGIPGLGFPRMLAGLDETPDCPVVEGIFVCTREGRQGLTHTMEIAFLDAAGMLQSAYDEAETASIHLISSMAGSVEGNRGARTIDRTRDMTVSGLAGAESTRIWNGTSEGTASHTFATGTYAGTPLVRTSTSRTVDVVIPHPRGDDSWPLSGTIHSEMVVEGGDRAGTYAATVTFNGTQFVTVSVNGEDVTVDLSVRRGFRGRHPRRH